MSSLQSQDLYKYILYLYISTDNDTKADYFTRVEDHNSSLCGNSHMDSGFDILVPEDQTAQVNQVNNIDFKIKCEMVKRDKESNSYIPSAFYMYPRSSISKSKFRLANNVGIIDSGYRGNLMGMFDLVYTQVPVICTKGTRLLQICSPTLEPFKVVIVENDSLLSNTSRGNGGFGSTGGTNI